MYRPHFVYLFLCCFHHLAIANNTAVHLSVQISFLVLTFHSLGVYIPRNGIAGSCGWSIFQCLKNCQTVLQGSCTQFPPAQGFWFLCILTNSFFLFGFPRILTSTTYEEKKQHMTASITVWSFIHYLWKSVPKLELFLNIQSPLFFPWCETQPLFHPKPNFKVAWWLLSMKSGCS